MQTERVFAKDNTVAIGERLWQLDQTRFRTTLSGCTVTIHEHLDGRISIRYGPNVVGRYEADGQPVAPTRSGIPAGRGKAAPVEALENQKPVSQRSHRRLEIPQPQRDSHFPTASATSPSPNKFQRKAASASRRGTAGAIN